MNYENCKKRYKLIKELSSKGLTQRQIGKEIGVWSSTVNWYLHSWRDIKDDYHPSYFREYAIWCGMVRRCNDVKNINYYKYGAKGITVDKSWAKSFEDFIKDIGFSPSDKHTIDRIDNSKGYCKENCRWATWTEQQNNKTNNVYVNLNGEIMTVAQASRKYNIKDTTIRYRMKKGFDVTVRRPNNGPIKKVIAIDKNNKKFIFRSITEASRKFNILNASISNCLKKRTKTSGGYKWRYYGKERIQ